VKLAEKKKGVKLVSQLQGKKKVRVAGGRKNKSVLAFLRRS
jgi:hypothetical protein